MCEDASTVQARQRAYAYGLKAEAMAEEYLLTHGYDIRERRWSPGAGKSEIDLIACRGAVMAFVEVKARMDASADPVAAVTPRKQRFMALAADVYLRGQTLPYEYRYDIIAVHGPEQDMHLEHIPDAFLSPLFTKK